MTNFLPYKRGDEMGKVNGEVLKILPLQSMVSQTGVWGPAGLGWGNSSPGPGLLEGATGPRMAGGPRRGDGTEAGQGAAGRG